MKRIGLTLMTILLMSIPGYSQKYNYVDVDTVQVLNNIYMCHSTYAPNDSVIWVDYASQILRSLDKGDSWEEIAVPVYSKWTSLRPLNTDTAFFSAMYSGFYKTMNGGKTWEDMNKVENHPNHFHFFDNNEGVIVEAKLKIPWVISGIEDFTRIWTTSDGGYSWIEVQVPDRPGFLPGELWYHHANNMNRQTIGDTIFFGTSMGRIFRSFDRGNSWEAFYTGLGMDQYIISIAQHSTKNMMVLSDGGDYGTSFKSSFTSDGGNTWDTYDLDYGSASIEAIPGQDSSFVLLKGNYNQSSGLFITHDGGRTYSENLFDVPCHTMTFINDSTAIMPSTYKNQSGAPNSDYLFRLKFRYKEDYSGIEKSNSSIIRIYPNPVSDMLTIEAGSVDQYSINITSLNGQLIHSEEMEGTTYQLDLSSFQKGVYFITIRSEDFVTTRKIIKY